MVESDYNFLVIFIGIFRLIYLHNNGIPVLAPCLTQPDPYVLLKH